MVEKNLPYIEEIDEPLLPEVIWYVWNYVFKQLIYFNYLIEYKNKINK